MLKMESKISAELRRLEPFLYFHNTPVLNWTAKRANYISVNQYEMLDQDWVEVPEYGRITGKEITVFLKNRIVLDESYHGSTVVLLLRVSGESCIRVNGKLHSGLDRNRNMVLLSKCAQAGDVFELEVETNCKDLIEGVCITQSELAQIDQCVWEYYYEVKTAFDFILDCGEEFTRQGVFNAIYDSLLLLDYTGVRVSEESINSALAYLRARMARYEQIKLPVALHFAGHSHIDVAWLWPLKETVRKVGRTFPSMLRLMEQYPDFRFCQSMPVLYEMAKEYYPDVYEQVKQRVKEGRWETLGSMYLETDCNLVSGESFVRQIMYGKKFWKEEFGTDSRVCFLPDVFGFSAALPQILKKTGTDYFFTSKLTWNETNDFPYSVFRWRGLDGSEVLAGMQTMCTSRGRDLYSGDLSAAGVRMSMDLLKNKGNVDSMIYLYGYGDGGGGVTKEMLETVTRLDKQPMMPEVRIGTVEQYFDELDRSKNYPVWDGELYFEKHRGTYTSIAKNKRNNRKSELLYRDAEILDCFRYIEKEEFASKALEPGWKKILLNQFHDILPGTSINEVYEESERQYEEVFRIGKESVQNSLTSLAEQCEDVFTVYNTLSWSRSQVVTVDGQGKAAVTDREGNYPLQCKNKDGSISFLAEEVPPLGYRTYSLTDEVSADRMSAAEGKAEVCQNPDGTIKVENAWLAICFNEKGEITSLFDKTAHRAVLKEAQTGNRLKLYEDIPVEWGAAWETTRKREDKLPISIQTHRLEVVQSNCLFTKIVMEGNIHNSGVKQNIIVYHHLPCVAFETEVDWNEKHKFLKASFPVDIHALNARCDIAFGNTLHPTHATTSQDEAQFEVCGHKWGDISDGGYGVALMNDCKYGYSFQNCDMELSLLKSPDYPAENCDRGVHLVTYWLYPHVGDFKSGKVAQAGYEANVPLLVYNGKAAQAEGCYISTDCENVIIDTLKPSEDGNAVILRLFETYNTVSEGKLHFGFPVSRCVETDLLENEIREIPVSDGAVSFTVKPYEIKTYKIIT